MNWLIECLIKINPLFIWSFPSIVFRYAVADKYSVPRRERSWCKAVAQGCIWFWLLPPDNIQQVHGTGDAAWELMGAARSLQTPSEWVPARPRSILGLPKTLSMHRNTLGVLAEIFITIYKNTKISQWAGINIWEIFIYIIYIYTYMLCVYKLHKFI